MFPPSDDFELTPWHINPDYSNRIDLSARAASKLQRIFGFAASIDECTGENTDTAYLFEVITRIPYLPDGRTGRSPDQPSWLYVAGKSDSFIGNRISLTVKVLAYSSNALIMERTGIALGSFVTGILAANYSGRGRAQLDAWQLVANLDLWRNSAPDTAPGSSCYDWTEWAVEWTPTLGGAAYAVDEPGENRINGVRITNVSNSYAWFDFELIMPRIWTYTFSFGLVGRP